MDNAKLHQLWQDRVDALQSTRDAVGVQLDEAKVRVEIAKVAPADDGGSEVAPAEASVAALEKRADFLDGSIAKAVDRVKKIEAK